MSLREGYAVPLLQDASVTGAPAKWPGGRTAIVAWITNNSSGQFAGNVQLYLKAANPNNAKDIPVAAVQAEGISTVVDLPAGNYYVVVAGQAGSHMNVTLASVPYT